MMTIIMTLGLIMVNYDTIGIMMIKRNNNVSDNGKDNMNNDNNKRLFILKMHTGLEKVTLQYY